MGKFNNYKYLILMIELHSFNHLISGNDMTKEKGKLIKGPP